MRRYSWTKTTMVLAELGGAYVTYHDHQRAMAEKDAEIARLESVVASFVPQRCNACKDKGPHHHCTHVVGVQTCGIRPMQHAPGCTPVHSEGSACGCIVCAGTPKPFVKLYKCNTCKDTGCTDCY